jgi:hypothetical protein
MRLIRLTPANLSPSRRMDHSTVRNTKQPEGLLGPLSHADNEPALKLALFDEPQQRLIQFAIILVGLAAVAVPKPTVRTAQPHAA